MPAFIKTRRFFGSIIRAARSNRLTRRIYFRWRLRERLVLEFRGNNNLELPLLRFANLEATGAREAVEVASVIPPKELPIGI